MSVQNYETDVLQEHVDSTSILINRLDQWRHAVHVVQNYAQGYLQLHQGVTNNLEKTLKSINDVPTFSGMVGNEDSGSQLALVFRNMQSNVNVLLQRSNATAGSIKSTVLPSLEEVVVEIDKHYKSLRSHGSKGMKEVEKTREQTQKHVEQLGQVASSYGARTLSPHEDPLILRRKAEAAVSEQVSRENMQAEAALNVQQSFGALEAHVMQTINQALTSLGTLNEGFDKAEYEVNSTIADSFKSVDMNKEWQLFNKANAEHMVPTSNFKRDPKFVTFANKDHVSTKPVIEGLLNRKGTVLKSYNQGYYIISPSGYLYQFKSANPLQDLTPELSLYLPGCQVSKSSKPGEYVFRVVGKDSKKAISTRHKYVFKANSQGELDTWFNAVARISGNVGATDANDDDSAEGELASPSETPLQSPIEPPSQQMANTSLDQRAPVAQAGPTNATGVPQSGVQSGVPQSSVPQSGVPQSGVPHSGVPQAASTGVPQSAVPQAASAAPTQASSGLQGAVPSQTSQAAPQAIPLSQTAQTATSTQGVPGGSAVPHAGGADPFKGF